MEKLAQYAVETLTLDEQQNTDGGCWVCHIWGPIRFDDPICPGADSTAMAVA